MMCDARPKEMFRRCVSPPARAFQSSPSQCNAFIQLPPAFNEAVQIIPPRVLEIGKQKNVFLASRLSGHAAQDD